MEASHTVGEILIAAAQLSAQNNKYGYCCDFWLLILDCDLLFEAVILPTTD